MQLNVLCHGEITENSVRIKLFFFSPLSSWDEHKHSLLEDGALSSRGWKVGLPSGAH